MRAVPLALLVLLPGCGALQSLAADGPALAGQARIERDAWGVPHISGPTDAAVAFALGYAQAEDNLRQIEDDVLRAIGRAANLYGDRELPNDLLKAAFEVPRHARAEYAREPDERRRVWDAFVAGMNHYLTEHPTVRLRLLARFEPWHLFALARDVSPGMRIDGVRLGDADSSSAPLPGGAVTVAHLDTATGAARPDTARASIAWAVAPARADSGHALLLHSLDRPYEGAGQPYEARLQSGESGRVFGYAALGTPVIRAGHTDSHAWAHTGSTSDTHDAWLLRFDHPSDPLAYRWGDGWQTTEAFTDTLAVNTTQGVVRRPYTFLRTPLGPVVARHGDSAAIAVRIARLEEGGALQQWYAMGRAQSLGEFRAALALTSLVGVNTVYADTAGNILYVHGSAVPRRAAGVDPGRLLDGSDATLWDGYHSLEELPEVLNPGNGWLQSAGGSPFQVAADGYNLDATRYPAYLAHSPDNARTRRARELLRAEESWTAAELETVAFDVRATAAGPLLRRLVDEYEQRGALDPAGVLPLDEAVQRLRAWDSRASIESTEMTLFVTWYERLQSPFAAIEAGWPLTRALGWTLERLREEWGSTDVPWGTLNRLARPGAAAGDSIGVPVPGGAAWTGSLFGAASVGGAPGTARPVAAGIAWSGVVELGPPPRMRSVTAFGQSADPASPHFFDQARLMAEGRMKPVVDTAGRARQPE